MRSLPLTRRFATSPRKRGEVSTHQRRSGGPPTLSYVIPAAACRAGTLAAHAPLAVLVDGEHRLDDPQVNVMIERDRDLRASVLWKARAAEARPGMQEL